MNDISTSERVVTSKIGSEQFGGNNLTVTFSAVTFGFLKRFLWRLLWADGGSGGGFCVKPENAFMWCWCYSIANEIPDTYKEPSELSHWCDYMFALMFGYIRHDETKERIAGEDSAKKLYVFLGAVRLAVLYWATNHMFSLFIALALFFSHSAGWNSGICWCVSRSWSSFFFTSYKWAGRSSLNMDFYSDSFTL